MLKTQQYRLQGQNMYLEGLVWFLAVFPDAARTLKGSCTQMAAHEGEYNWGPPPLQKRLAPMLTKDLLSLSVLGVLQLCTCLAAVIKQGT